MAPINSYGAEKFEVLASVDINQIKLDPKLQLSLLELTQNLSKLCKMIERLEWPLKIAIIGFSASILCTSLSNIYLKFKKVSGGLRRRSNSK